MRWACERQLRALQQLAGPALDDVRQVIATVRTEVEAVTATSRDVRGRILKAADAAEARLVQVNALLGGVQGSVQATVIDLAATVRMLLRSISLIDWGRERLKRGRKKR